MVKGRVTPVSLFVSRFLQVIAPATVIHSLATEPAPGAEKVESVSLLGSGASISFQQQAEWLALAAS
jgi:hypothetical protein